MLRESKDHRLRFRRATLLTVLALSWWLGAPPATAWNYVTFTSPSYGQTNFVRPAGIVLEGMAIDYSDVFSAYTLITNVAIWADTSLLGTADLQSGSNQTAWSFAWTNPPAPPATVRLTVVACAESGNCSTSRTAIAITSNNTPPLAFAVAARTVEATPVFFSPYYQHSDAAQTCTLVVVTQPTNGLVTIETRGRGGSTGGGGLGNEPSQKDQEGFLYTPEPGFVGTNTFTFRVNDGYDNSNLSTATVTVVTNTPPIARNVTNATVAGSSPTLLIYPSYSDPDSSVQTIQPILVDQAAHGWVDATNTSYGTACFLYSVPTGYVGRDVFTYRVNDGFLDSNVATGLVNIITNTPPVALPMRACTAPTTTVTLTVTYTDADLVYGVPQSFSVRPTSLPGHGALTTNGLSFRYTPEPGFESGIDTFRFVVSDGTAESGEAECRVKVRPHRDRAGSVVAVVVTSNLYVNVSNEVNRLTADLSREGYKARLRLWPSSGSSVSNLWAYLKQEYDNTDQWLVGSVLIGSLPKARVTISGVSHYTDQVYWNMRAYQADVTPTRRDIWVSRIISESATYGNEATLIRRALEANHAYRTGASRLPFTACYYINPEWWASYAGGVEALGDVWPVTEFRGANKAAMRFAPERSDLSAYAGADAFAHGGEVLDETSHGNADGYMAYGGWFTRADLFRTIAQQRVALITSCTSGAYDGIVNQTIFTRGGGCVLAVGGSEINYVGDFTLVGTSRAPFRTALANGESWGEAMLAAYPFGASQRTLMFGDLSLGTLASGTSNALPHIRSWSWTEKAGRSVTFTVDASDADGCISNIEWFCEGYDAGRRAPSGTGTQASFTYTYPAPGTYPVRVEIMDDRQARDWREFTVTVQGPPNGPMVLLSADNRITNLYINGAAVSLGPNAADWTKSDTYGTDTVTCLALKALNDQPPSNSAAVLALVLFPDGHTEGSDGTWKAYDGSGGPPPDDASGHPWQATDYDDSAWPAATVAGAFGMAPWGRPAGLAMLDKASWIWAGDPLHGVSPVYLRRRFVPWTLLDSDSDGVSDAEESIAGTDRTNSASRLVLVAHPQASGDAGRLWFNAVSGRSYTVWYRASLLTGEWQVLPDYSNQWLTGAGPVSIDTSNTATQVFFRLGVLR
jgi:hypothetical protein